MRQITRDAVQAFRNNEDFNRSNTSVQPRSYTGAAAMFLHGNCIARRQIDGTVEVSSAGWQSNTTKERLNGLLDSLGCLGIYQKDFQWYWSDGTEFSDGWQAVKPRV